MRRPIAKCGWPVNAYTYVGVAGSEYELKFTPPYVPGAETLPPLGIHVLQAVAEAVHIH